MSEKQPPKRIWLCWYGDSVENGPPPHMEDVLWCEDKMEDCDIEYVAAAELAAVTAERDAMSAAITAFCEEQKWTSQTYKHQPHTRPLFDICEKGNK